MIVSGSGGVGVEGLTARAVEVELAVAERAEQTRLLAERTAGMEFSGSVQGGAVRARVSASGLLVGLELAEVVTSWPAARIAEQVLAATRVAQASIAAGMGPVFAATVGADSPVAQALLAGYEERFGAPADDGPGPVRRGGLGSARTWGA